MQIKNHFELKKNITQLLISNFLLGDCSLMYKKDSENLLIFFSYLRSLLFFENENFALAKFNDFLELTS